MSITMTRTEREAFLAEVHVGVISVERANAAPLCVPIWYDYAPDTGVWVITGGQSQKGRALAAAGRFSLCAQVETPPFYRYVSVEGPIELADADRERHLRPLARRYLGVEGGDRYTETSAGAPGETLLVTLRPERWLTVDYGKG